MNYPVTIFLLAAVICWMVTYAQDEGCGYAKCIFEGQNGSRVDRVLVQFNFSEIPADVATECPVLQQRIDNCSHFQSSCPQNITKPWDQRLTDDWYVIYLMELGDWACTGVGPDNLYNISLCTDSTTHDRMQTCVGDPYKFTAECAFKEFRDNSLCSNDTQRAVDILIDALAMNPYNN